MVRKSPWCVISISDATSCGADRTHVVDMRARHPHLILFVAIAPAADEQYLSMSPDDCVFSLSRPVPSGAAICSGCIGG